MAAIPTGQGCLPAQDMSTLFAPKPLVQDATTEPSRRGRRGAAAWPHLPQVPQMLHQARSKACWARTTPAAAAAAAAPVPPLDAARRPTNGGSPLASRTLLSVTRGE